MFPQVIVIEGIPYYLITTKYNPVLEEMQGVYRTYDVSQEDWGDQVTLGLKEAFENEWM